MDGGKKRIPRAEFHGIFLNFAECGRGVKRGKSIFRGKKRNFSFFCGIPQKKFFFFTIFFLIKKNFFLIFFSVSKYKNLFKKFFSKFLIVSDN